MSDNPLRDMLNRLRWDPATEAAGIHLGVETRVDGAPTVEEVAFARVEEILPGGVTLGDGTFVPYHRVIRITRRDRTIWRRDEGR